MADSRNILGRTECGPGRFCPTDPLLRWTMAVWLVRALDGADPTPADTVRFADVDHNLWWAAHTERLADLGVTQGCATEPLRYCPDQVVTRAQMATFLTRAFDLQDTGGVVSFTDVSDGPHAPAIRTLAAAGITAGCATEPLRYCPDQVVTRAQMATFLARTLGLVPLPQPTATPRIAYSAAGNGLWVEDADGANKRQLTDGGVHGAGWSPGGRRIAYDGWDSTTGTEDSSRREGLWVVDADGNNKRQLADGRILWAGWMAEGRIAYKLNVPGGTDPLLVVDADGTNEYLLTDAYDAWWCCPSPDGRRFFYVGSEYSPSSETYESGLWVVDADGTNKRRLTLQTHLRAAVWSPDGRRIAYTDNGNSTDTRGIWVVDADGYQQTKLAERIAYRLAWSPDSRRIAYRQRGSSVFGTVDPATWQGLWVVDADGANQHQLVGGDAHSQVWSPDGGRIAYRLLVSTHYDQLWVVDADGANNRQLGEWADEVAWSPDGRRIAYTIFDPFTARDGMWVVDADGANQHQLTDRDARSPMWSPDGGHIAYEIGGVVWVVDADGTNQRQLVHGGVSWFGWSPR